MCKKISEYFASFISLISCRSIKTYIDTAIIKIRFCLIYSNFKITTCINTKVLITSRNKMSNYFTAGHKDMKIKFRTS